jgi:hypothetical protein
MLSGRSDVRLCGTADAVGASKAGAAARLLGQQVETPELVLDRLDLEALEPCLSRVPLHRVWSHHRSGAGRVVAHHSDR